MDLYQQNILDHYKHPRHQGKPVNATHQGELANPLCGDLINFFVEVKRGKILSAGWEGEGCVLSLASADLLAEYVTGKPVTVVQQLDQAWVIDALGTAPSPSRLKCALLPLEALQGSLV